MSYYAVIATDEESDDDNALLAESASVRTTDADAVSLLPALLVPSPPSPSVSTSASVKRRLVEGEMSASRLDRGRMKKLRRRLEQNRGTLDEYVSVYGANARAAITVAASAVLVNGRTALNVRDVHQLMEFVVSDTAPSPRWARVSNKPLIRRTILIAVDALSPAIYDAHIASAIANAPPTPMQVKTALFAQHAHMTDVLHAHVPRQTVAVSAPIISPAPPPAPAPADTSSVCASVFCLTARELLSNGYPTAETAGAGFVETSDAAADTDTDTTSVRLFGIDCEMCYTAAGLELTRATLVDADGAVVLDRLVLPHNDILNYNTQFSGITADTLSAVTTRLDDVRAEILSVVRARDIIVGHSLENDLRALRLIHRRCIDTAVLYVHPRGPPHKSSLRYLSKKYLNTEIQVGSGGHDSAEDAAAAIKLAKLKIARGRDFGMTTPRTQPLLTMMAAGGRGASLIAGIDIIRIAVDPGAADNVDMIPVNTDAEAVERAEKLISASSLRPFVFLHLTRIRRTIDTGADIPTALTDTAAVLSSLYASAPPNTLFVVISGEAATEDIRKRRSAQNESGANAAATASAVISRDVAEASKGVISSSVKQ